MLLLLIVISPNGITQVNADFGISIDEVFRFQLTKYDNNGENIWWVLSYQGPTFPLGIGEGSLFTVTANSLDTDELNNGQKVLYVDYAVSEAKVTSITSIEGGGIFISTDWDYLSELYSDLLTENVTRVLMNNETVFEYTFDMFVEENQTSANGVNTWIEQRTTFEHAQYSKQNGVLISLESKTNVTKIFSDESVDTDLKEIAVEFIEQVQIETSSVSSTNTSTPPLIESVTQTSVHKINYPFALFAILSQLILVVFYIRRKVGSN